MSRVSNEKLWWSARLRAYRRRGVAGADVAPTLDFLLAFKTVAAKLHIHTTISTQFVELFTMASSQESKPLTLTVLGSGT